MKDHPVSKHILNILDKFPLFSPSGKMILQIPCFPCNVTTLLCILFFGKGPSMLPKLNIIFMFQKFWCAH